MVASGSKTLSLSISDNPSSITKLKVDLEGKEIKLGAERKTVPTNIGDSINTARKY